MFIKKGFTLAEVLIVIIVLGFVAILIMPVLLQELSMRINSNRQANIAQKMTKAVENMIVNGGYDNITNTEEFVDRLSKYLKIAKRCSSSNIDSCWPSKQVKTPSGGKYEVKNAKKGSDIHVNSDENNVGLVLADGAALILSFNPETPTPSTENGFIPSTKTLPIGKNKYKEFAYTSNATAAIDFVMDVNGGTGPNQEPSNEGVYYDIRPFKIALFSKADCAGIRYKGLCLIDIGTSYDSVNCLDEKYARYCKPYASTNSAFDYWAGANKTCADIGMRLPTPQEWKDLNNSDFEYRPQNPVQYFSNYQRHSMTVGHIISGDGSTWRERTTQYSVMCIGN